MKGDETKGSRSEPKHAPGKASAARYEQVFDGRKSRVRAFALSGREARSSMPDFQPPTTPDAPGIPSAVWKADHGPCRQGRTSKPQNRSQQAEHPTDGRCPSFAEFGARYLSEGSANKQRPPSARNEPTSHGGRRASEPCRSIESIAPTSTRESPTASVSHN